MFGTNYPMLDPAQALDHLDDLDLDDEGRDLFLRGQRQARLLALTRTRARGIPGTT